MKFNVIKTILLLSVVLNILTATNVNSTSASFGPQPGFIGHTSYTGIPTPGGVIEVTCRFSIAADALGSVLLDSLKREFIKLPNDMDLKRDIERPDSLLMFADTSIEIIGAKGWGGRIEPGIEYVFSTTIRFKSLSNSQVSLALVTRYGVQVIRGVAFAAENSSPSIGYVTQVITDSIGNYWHKHLGVADSTVEGFLPFNSSIGLPPDTSFDKTGKVLLIIKVIDPSTNNSKIKPHGTPPKLQPGINQYQQEKNRKNSKDGSLGALKERSNTETDGNKLEPLKANKSKSAFYTLSGVFQYQHAVTSHFSPTRLTCLFSYVHLYSSREEQNYSSHSAYQSYVN